MVQNDVCAGSDTTVHLLKVESFSVLIENLILKGVCIQASFVTRQIVLKPIVVQFAFLYKYDVDS